MVCEKCEKKLSKIVTPDPWKSASRNKGQSSSRVVGENKALTGRRKRYEPYKEKKFERCRICRQMVHQFGSHYCQDCAFTKGICAMCGKKLYQTKNYNQSTV